MGRVRLLNSSFVASFSSFPTYVFFYFLLLTLFTFALCTSIRRYDYYGHQVKSGYAVADASNVAVLDVQVDADLKGYFDVVVQGESGPLPGNQ